MNIGIPSFRNISEGMIRRRKDRSQQVRYPKRGALPYTVPLFGGLDWSNGASHIDCCASLQPYHIKSRLSTLQYWRYRAIKKFRIFRRAAAAQ